MLGAVMFGHRHFQPVIDAIIRLAEKAAKEPREFDRRRQCGAREGNARSRRAGSARRLCDPGKTERHDAVDAAKDKVMAHFCPRRRREPEHPQAAGRRRVQGARSQDRALEHSRHRQAHRRPRREDRAPDRLRSRRAAAHPRLGAVHPRRDAGAGRRHARHRRGRAVRSTRCRAPTRRPSCCTTTSRPSRSARRAASARPAGARSATASSPGARSVRCCRRSTSSPTRSASSPRSPSRTARPRWRRCAAPRWR